MTPSLPVSGWRSSTTCWPPAGTSAAAVRLVEGLGGEVVGLGFLLELAFLGGAARLDGRDHVSLVTYDL